MRIYKRTGLCHETGLIDIAPLKIERNSSNTEPKTLKSGEREPNPVS